MTAWLVCLWFGAWRVSGAILSALRGIVGAGRACVGSPSDHRGGGRADAALSQRESGVAGED
jgi:hypothetical protein